MRRLIPYSYFLGFVVFHFILIWSHVPLKNQIPATLGVSAFTAMSLCFVFAARNTRIDALIGGPGRSYRLHRWLGYWAVVCTIGHWILAQPHGNGYIPKYAAFAGQSGEYAAIALIILICATLLKFIPYHVWKFSHYLMGPLYLIIVFHTFFAAIPVAPWGLLWWILVFIALTGIWGLLCTIANHLYSNKKYRVTSITHMRDVMDIRMTPENETHQVNWAPGQFATIYCTRAGLKEPHPFTISSSSKSQELRFVINTTGDYTARLANHLQVGDTIHLRSIRGEFKPNVSPHRNLRQIWVAGGVGISPFLAAMDAMEPDDGPEIDLFYCYRSLGYTVNIEALVAHADRLPQLVIHFLGERDGAVFTDDIFPSRLTDNWREAELFICGPTLFSDKVCSAYRLHNGQHKINAELFEFRPSLSIMSKFSKTTKFNHHQPYYDNSKKLGVITHGRGKQRK